MVGACFDLTPAGAGAPPTQRTQRTLLSSDEPEPSWLEPGLELNNFQLGS
jgi:hypothetical protein